MAFDVLITDEADADLDSIASYVRRQDGEAAARKWFASITASIKSLKEMPARCAMAPEADDLNTEVRIRLHGRGKQTFKIYYEIRTETASPGTVRVLSVRHWARKPLGDDELQDLTDDTEDGEALQ